MLNRQLVFNAAALGLKAQKAFSTSPNPDEKDVGGSCRYRSPEGHKCGVGFLIPDERYREVFEGRVASSDYVSGNLGDEFYDDEGRTASFQDKTFLADLQFLLHDNLRKESDGLWHQELFEQAVADFAKAKNLKNPLEK